MRKEHDTRVVKHMVDDAKGVKHMLAVVKGPKHVVNDVKGETGRVVVYLRYEAEALLNESDLADTFGKDCSARNVTQQYAW